MASTTVLGSIILLSRTVPTDHAIGMFIRMIAFGIVASITGEDLRTATEAKPAVALAVVGTAAIAGQGLACGNAKGVFGPFAHRGEVCAGGGGYEEEFDFGDFEGWIPVSIGG